MNNPLDDLFNELRRPLDMNGEAEAHVNTSDAEGLPSDWSHSGEPECNETEKQECVDQIPLWMKAICEILKAGRALHLSEIAKRLGIPYQATLCSNLVKFGIFRRTEVVGTYGLSDNWAEAVERQYSRPKIEALMDYLKKENLSVRTGKPTEAKPPNANEFEECYSLLLRMQRDQVALTSGNQKQALQDLKECQTKANLAESELNQALRRLKALEAVNL
jgi:hypothetical protein